jgi:hypothetical protein
MVLSRVVEIIRHFRENGLKLLLEHPANARELLTLTATRLAVALAGVVVVHPGAGVS